MTKRPTKPLEIKRQSHKILEFVVEIRNSPEIPSVIPVENYLPLDIASKTLDVWNGYANWLFNIFLWSRSPPENLQVKLPRVRLTYKSISVCRLCRFPPRWRWVSSVWTTPPMLSLWRNARRTCSSLEDVLSLSWNQKFSYNTYNLYQFISN